MTGKVGKPDAPLQLHAEKVVPGWIDYNGHMNLAYYVLIFDHATDAFLDFIGLTETFRSKNRCSTFSAELHVTYEKEVREGEEIFVTTQLLGFDGKRIHYFHNMYEKTSGELAATNELLSLYMDMDERRVGKMPVEIRQRLDEIEAVHTELPVPSQVGRKIGLHRRKY